MFREGKPQGPAPQSESDHLIRCTICGQMLDMRDLGDVLAHLRGEEIEEEPASQLTEDRRLFSLHVFQTVSVF